MAEHHGYDNNLINHLVETVHINLNDESFGAGELALAAGMSQRKLSCKIRIMLKMSVSQFIREIRLRKALEMLQNEDITAAEAAFRVGFGSATYFNKCFHEYFGYPPGKIRKGDVILPVELYKDRSVINLSPGKTIFRRTAGALTIFFIITVVAITGYYLISAKTTAVTSAKGSADHGIYLAILPFRNLADSAANQYFVDGLREEILTSLSKIHSLRVISILSESIISRNNVSAVSLGKKLHADYLVAGSGQKNSNTYDLRVQLIDTRTGCQKWADSYTTNIRATNDIFNIQNQIALSIVTNLKAAITPEERELIGKSPTRNIKAWDLYQRGMYELAKSPFVRYNEGAVKKGDEYFRLALKYDSSLAEAYIGRAWVYLSKAEISDYSARYLDSLLVLANIALSYNDKLSDAYYTRGFYYFFSKDTEQAAKEYEKALLYNPSSWYVYQALGFCMDDPVKSFEMEIKAAALNHDTDLPIYYEDIGTMFYGAGFPEKGDFYFREALKLDGDSVTYSDNLMEVEARTKGDYLKALQYYKRKYLIDTTDALTLLNLGYYSLLNRNYKESLFYYNRYIQYKKHCARNITYERQIKEPYIGLALLRNGYYKDADSFFEKIIRESNSKDMSRPWLIDDYTLAGIYALKGNKSMAYKYLELFSKEIRTYLLMWLTRIGNDPYFDSLRDEPRFRNILLSIESRYRSDHEKIRKWLEEHGEV